MVEKWLKEPECKSIGVWGMGGVGKTTLLMRIFNKLLSDPNIAGSVYWVHVGHEVKEGRRLSDLQRKIASKIGLFGKTTSGITAACLYRKLTKMKKVVLILDDVWDWSTLDDIGIPNGCKILLSTRRRDVCRYMSCERYVLHIKSLSENDALKFFEHRFKIYTTLAAEVRKIAASVVWEGRCLPLAIKIIADCMNGLSNLQEWQDNLDNLRKLDAGLHEIKKRVFEELEPSYNHLDSEEKKQCFLSCMLYPEGHEMIREELIDLWNMEEVLAKYILKELENSCLLEPCSTWSLGKCLKMNDLMREMAIFLSKKHSLAKSGLKLETVPENEFRNKQLVKASLSHNNLKEIPGEMPPESTASLTVLLLNHNGQLSGIPELFLVHMKALEVLDLSWTCIDSLPDCISDLKNLRMLLLFGCLKLKYVPSVAELAKLTVLSLPGHLEALPMGLERLKSLEKLIMYHKRKISYVINLDTLAESPEFYNHSVLKLDTKKCFATAFRQVVYFGDNDCQKSITIAGGMFRDDETSAGFVELKFLAVRSYQEFKNLATSAARPQESSCRKLQIVEHLVLESLRDLRRITRLEVHSFSHLKTLRIERCSSIEVGLPFESPHSLHDGPTHCLLPNLEQITVWGCQELKAVFESNTTSSSSSSSSEISGANFNPIFALPKLKKLVLSSLPMLHSIYRGLLLCTSLEGGGVHIEECPQLKLLKLSKSICDSSPASLASIPRQDERPELWKLLQENYTEDAAVLSKLKDSTSPDGDRTNGEELEGATRRSNAKPSRSKRRPKCFIFF